MKAKLFLVLFVLQVLFFLKVEACTTFVLKDSSQIVFGRNFDFNVGSGFVVNNPKGISKYALVSNEDNVMRWISKFGSVTFNQFGREFPYEGMNEKGLVVALMIL
jgi:choloylglycine hydrolase